MTINRIVAAGLSLAFAASLVRGRPSRQPREAQPRAAHLARLPWRSDHRVVLKNGIVQESKTAPCPGQHPGDRAPARGQERAWPGSPVLQMRAGGTRSLTAEQFDREGRLPAAQIGSSL